MRMIGDDGRSIWYTKTWEQLADALRSEREFWGLSQKQLSDKSGVALDTIICAESGVPVRVKDSEKLLDTLQIDNVFLPMSLKLENQALHEESLAE